MDSNDFIFTDTPVLFIRTVDGWLPAACLTNVPFERTTERIETSARGSGGDRSYLAGMHDYSLSFNGILTKAEGVVSYNDLDQLQQDRIVFEWRLITSDGWIAKTGTSFITSLRVTFEAGQWVSFSCALSPAAGGARNMNLMWTENGFNVVTENGSNAITI